MTIESAPMADTETVSDERLRQTMLEAASALQPLKAERDAALRIINMSPADHTRSAVP